MTTHRQAPDPAVQAPGDGLGGGSRMPPEPTASAVDLSQAASPVPSGPSAAAGLATHSAPPKPVVRPVSSPAAAPKAGILAGDGTVPAVARHRRFAARHSFNPRLALVRVISAGLTAVLTVLIVPGLKFSGSEWWRIVLVAVVFGLLNAIVKPALQFFVLRFIISTYGLVVILINIVLLGLLAALSDGLIEVEDGRALVFGGVLIGALGLIFDTLLGANPPMLDKRLEGEGDAS